MERRGGFLYLCMTFLCFRLFTVHSQLFSIEPLSECPSGEHEIDYILFITVPSKESLTVKLHGDEVDDIRWVTQSQLLEMFKDKTLLFSPWFRLIAKKWMMGNPNNDIEAKNDAGENGAIGTGWWEDLDG